MNTSTVSSKSTLPTMVVKFPNCTSFFSDKVVYGYRIYLGNRYRDVDRQEAMEWVRQHGLVINREGFDGSLIDPDEGTVWDSPAKDFFRKYNTKKYDKGFLKTKDSHATLNDTRQRKQYYRFYPYGSTENGFIFATGVSRREDKTIIEGYLRWCERHGDSAEFGRISHAEMKKVCAENRRYNRHHTKEALRMPVDTQTLAPIHQVLSLASVS